MLGLGTVIGAGLVITAAVGMQYSDSRPFCATCHVMEQAALTHSRSPHAKLACNDCHAPHNLLAKIPVKARAGLTDFLANISGRDVPLQAGTWTRDIVDANCRACHGVTVGGIMDAKPYCADCHRGTAHQNKTPISQREAADE